MFIFPVEFHDFVFIFLQLKYNIVFWYLNSDIFVEGKILSLEVPREMKNKNIIVRNRFYRTSSHIHTLDNLIN